MLKIRVLLLLIGLGLMPVESFAQSRGKVVGEIIGSLAPQVAKRTGDNVVRLSDELAAELTGRYGSEATRFLNSGGRDLLEVAGKQGNEAFRLVRSSSPEALNALTRNYDELMPLVRQRGGDLLELEARSPGIAGRAAKVIESPETLHQLARKAPLEDTPQMVSALERAESREVRELIEKSYLSRGGAFLRQIPPRLVLSLGAVAAAYRLADGVANNPEPWTAPANRLFDRAGNLIVLIGGCCCLMFTLGLMNRFGLKVASPFRQRKASEAVATERAGSSMMPSPAGIQKEIVGG